MAPEVWNKGYNEKCDIWSAGVIMYTLLCGYPPFNGINTENLVNKIKKGKFTFPSTEWSIISKTAKDLIEKMLCFDFH